MSSGDEGEESRRARDREHVLGAVVPEAARGRMFLPRSERRQSQGSIQGERSSRRREQV